MHLARAGGSSGADRGDATSTRGVPVIAIVDCGAIAESLYLPAFSRHPSVLERVVLVDKDESRARRLADEFGVGSWLSDYHEALGNIDGAIIALPHNLHHTVSIDFLKGGAHVLCEKPLARTVVQAKEMVDQAEASGVTLSVNNNRRLLPSYLRVKELVSDGAIGRPLSVRYVEGFKFSWPSVSTFRFDWESSRGGVLLDTGAHVLDVICWWLGGKPELVSCTNDSFGGNEGVANIKFEYEECVGEIKLDWLRRHRSWYRIVGEEGMIDGDVFDYWSVNLTSKSGINRTIKVKSTGKGAGEPKGRIVENFLAVVCEAGEPLVPASDVIPSIEWIQECYEVATRSSLPWMDSVGMPEMASGTTVLVVGGSGFIGGRLVESLYMKGIASVRAGVRQWSSAARVARLPVEIVCCDAMDREQIAEAMAGATCVVNCAKGDKEAIVQGTKNLLAIAQSQGVDRFVHLSTTEVYGDVEGTIDEAFPYRRGLSEYADAKIEAEEACWAYCEKGLPVTVLRPSIVYGPFSSKWTDELADRLQSGSWRIFKKHGEGICNLVFVDDLISVILLAASHKGAIGQAFNINGTDLITWNQYFQRFAEALGLSGLDESDPTRSKVISTVMGLAGRSGSYVLERFRGPITKVTMRYDVLRRAKDRMKRATDTTPTLRELNLYSRKARYATLKAQEMLGYQARFDVGAGLRMSVDWLDHHGFFLQRT